MLTYADVALYLTLLGFVPAPPALRVKVMLRPSFTEAGVVKYDEDEPGWVDLATMTCGDDRNEKRNVCDLTCSQRIRDVLTATAREQANGSKHKPMLEIHVGPRHKARAIWIKVYEDGPIVKE